MAGITATGFEVPTWQEIYNAFAERWLAATGVQLRDNKPEGQFFKAIAEQLSNRGLDDSIVDALWPALHDVFYSGFITTATGIALDYLAKLVLRDGRRPATKATGTVWVRGTPGTTLNPGELPLVAHNGATFTNTRRVTINADGYAYAPIEAVEPGPSGNVAAGTISLRTNISGIEEVSNTPVTHVANIGTSVTRYLPIPDDELSSRFQLISLNGYDIIRSIVLKAKNEQESYRVFEVALFFYDHATEELLGRTPVQRAVLAKGESTDLTFPSLSLDLFGHTTIRCAPVVLAGSGELSFGFDETLTGWHENNEPQPRALYCQITTGAGGATAGGAPPEDDTSLRLRHLEALYTAGWGNPEAIRSHLMQLPGVFFARVLNNPLKEPQMINGVLMPPASIAAVVWGGDPDAIAQVLHDHVPFGTEMVGNVTRSVRGINNQLFPVRFFRPQPRIVTATVSIYPNEKFPIDGITRVKDALIAYVGGVDSKNQEHGGSPPGDTLFHSRALANIHGAVAGIWGIELLWGFEGEQQKEDDLSPEALQKPFMTPETITVLLRGKPL